MLNTLLKIGQWQSKGKSDWDRFLDKPRVLKQNKKGEKITNYVVGIVFDLDEHKVYLDPNSLKEYDEERDPERLKSLRILGRRNKAIYATAEPEKLIQIFKTFFGTIEGDGIDKGELIETIDNHLKELQSSKLYTLAQNIFSLRKSFLDNALKEGTGDNQFDYKTFLAPLKLGTNENLALVYACVKSIKFGFPEPTPISQIETYKEFLDATYFKSNDKEAKGVKSICYASGDLKDDVTHLNLGKSFSLNKMFVTTTKNYLSNFVAGESSNYRVSQENQAYLDISSDYLLDKPNRLNIKIAGLDHVIIPQFLSSENIDWEIALTKLKIGSELLFSFRALDDLTKNIEIQTSEIYWINFLAFESDGNFFKTTNLIKDVSKFHFKNVIDAFQNIEWEMREMKEVLDWDSAQKEYGKVTHFNFNSIFGLIPVRKDKEKKNSALLLFKSILEQRKVDIHQIFNHFAELMLCHYYERYGSYTNIRECGKEYFGLTVRDNVFKYLAFIQVLKTLNLINMEQEIQAIPPEDVMSDHEKRIDDFFSKMKFSGPQKAMFYLGRMLSAVAYLQKDKNKTVIDKVNYHGMDKEDIVRLRKDLFEKAKQYGKPEKIVFSDSNFGQYFDFNSWNMNPAEAVFFLLTGYSFGIVKKDSQS